MVAGRASTLPERIGPYRIEAVLGAGGMGVVYRAVSAAGTPVAVKTLRPDQLAEQSLHRFKREASIRVDHPNVVRPLDAGADDDGMLYIAFELLEGESLEQRLGRGPIAAGELLLLARQVTDGLGAVHEAGVVHRDVKPANLFCCSDGTVKILDFGVAQVSAGPKLTSQGTVIGTISYLSPEQARGRSDLDARTDVWATGAVMYECLAGRAPFERPSPVATLLAILQDSPEPVERAASGVPPDLGTVVARCLSKDPADRYADATLLGRALVDVRIDASGPAPPLAPPVVPSIRPGEQRMVAVLLARGPGDLSAVARIVEEHGGEAIPLLGEGIVGLFGGRAWEGDEVHRAVAAALLCRAAAARVAVGSGRARFVGTGISGGAVGAAERGCALGLSGVAVDAETARALGRGFRVERALDDFHEVVAVRGSAAAPAGGSAPALVGRDRELVRLEGAFHSTLRLHRAHAVALTGPLGIGKSRLRRELSRMLEHGPAPIRILRGRAEAVHGETAFSLFASVLRERAGRENGAEAAPDRSGDSILRMVGEAIDDRSEAETCAGFLRELLGMGPGTEGPTLVEALMDPELMRDRLALAVRDYIVGLCRRGPSALLLEDLQWADPASLDLLGRIVAALKDEPLLLVLSSREAVADVTEGELGGVPIERIELEPLSADLSATLARAVANRPLPDELVEELVKRSEGNPFFIEQMALALRERGEGGAGGLAGVPVPVTVEAALQARLDQLPEAARELCKRASVLGRPFLPDELEALGAGEPHEALRLLVERGILTSSGRSADEHAFRSRLVEQATYRLLTPEVREQLHREAAEYLEGARGVDPEEAGTHWERAGSPARAARSYALSAVRAYRRGDSETVLRCSERALELGPPDELLHDLHLARADALRFLGRRVEQGRHLQDALRYARSGAEQARALAEQVAWLSRAGRLEDAIDTATRAADAAREAKEKHTLVLALSRRADALTFAGRLDAADAALDEAEAASRGAMPGVQAVVQSRRALVAHTRGDVGAALSAFGRALELYRSAGAVRRAAAIEQNVAALYNGLGAYREAEAALREALESSRRVGHRISEGYALANLGYALTMQARPGEALDMLAAAGDLARGTGDARLGLCVRAYRLRALLAREEPSEVAVGAEDLADDCARQGQAGQEVMALVLAARARLRLGEPGRALEHSSRALRKRDELGGIEEDEGDVFVVHAEALQSCGRGEEAEAVRGRGRARVTELAARIRDPGWRDRFVKDVRAHAELLGGS